ncbi:ComF family protein [Bacillus sp. Y1]|nr:ComF family protein [Bacillus sp. Y1]AYA78026.1 ComF family protein [Bacillus sp. Y1]
MKCLYCGERIVLAIGWGSLLSREEEVLLCDQCTKQLVPIAGECCVRCSRPFQGWAEEFRKGDFCYDCVRWEEETKWKGILECNVSLYEYNDFLKGLVSRYKFCGDYVISKVFREKFRKAIKRLEFDLLVPVPLSDERLYERGFNQAESIIVEASFFPTVALKRIHTEKQSKKSRDERKNLENVFQLLNEIEVKGRSVVLVDDIYTTGSTLIYAAKLLKKNGAINVSSVTLARG